MANHVTPFDFKGSAIRTVVLEDGAPWFVVNDVCAALEISDGTRAASRIDDRYLRQAQVQDSAGRLRSTNVVNESGLYKLVLRSDKPEAERFQDWITDEVLPEIRRTGSYSLIPAEPLRNPALQHIVTLAIQMQATQDEQERLARIQDHQGARLTSLAEEVATVKALVPHVPDGSGHSVKELAHATGIKYLTMHKMLRQMGITYEDPQRDGYKPYAEWINRGWAREVLEKIPNGKSVWVTYFTDAGLAEVKRRLSA